MSDSESSLQRALRKLRAFVEAEAFVGYDPYDALLSNWNFSRMGRWGPILAIQVQKRNPVNLRPVLGIAKSTNPKGLGLLLHAYADLYLANPSEETEEILHLLFGKLMDCATPGYAGNAWGYNFDWASPGKYLPAYTPSIVVSGFVGQGIRKYYACTQNAEAFSALQGIGRFITTDLPRVENEEGVCFSYTPLRQDCCYNASLLGAETLASLYSLTGSAEYKDLAVKAVNYLLASQHQDGHWKYSRDLATNRERHQVDFHQGFVLHSLKNCMQDIGLKGSKYQIALQQGAYFYRHKQFTDAGRSFWRLPRHWPVDIHHQAQGIITFSQLGDLDSAYTDFAHKIAEWTIHHMQDESGFFYYRKGRFTTNKIAYMRWGQAWMMRALSQLSSRFPVAQGGKMSSVEHDVM